MAQTPFVHFVFGFFLLFGFLGIQGCQKKNPPKETEKPNPQNPTTEKTQQPKAIQQPKAPEKNVPELIVSKQEVVRNLLNIIKEANGGEPIPLEEIQKIPRKQLMPFFKMAQEKALRSAFANHYWNAMSPEKRQEIQKKIQEQISLMAMEKDIKRQLVQNANKEKQDLITQLKNDRVCIVQSVTITGKKAQEEVQHLKQACHAVAADNREVANFLKTYSDSSNAHYQYSTADILLSRFGSFLKKMGIDVDRIPEILKKIKGGRGARMLLIGSLSEQQSPAFILLHIAYVTPINENELPLYADKILKDEVIPNQYEQYLKKEIARFRVVER